MNKKYRGTVFLLIAFAFLLPKAVTAISEEPLKILFIGSSYFNYNDLPGLFQKLSEEGGEKVYTEAYMPSGLFLSDHARDQLTRSKIRSKNWDYVVLQGSGMVMAYQDSIAEYPFKPAMKSLIRSIERKHPASVVLFVQPWAFEDGMTWKSGWTDTYVEMQDKIIRNTMNYAEEMGFMVAPAGQAWYMVLKEKNYPLHYLHFRDWNHPSKKGSYLTACVLFSSIFHKSSTEIAFTAGLDPEEAFYFRQMASSTVLSGLNKF